MIVYIHFVTGASRHLRQSSLSPENSQQLTTLLCRAVVGWRRATRKQRSSGEAAVAGGNNHSGKVLPEIMIIGILNKIAVRRGL